jgi:hypothetical protein
VDHDCLFVRQYQGEILNKKLVQQRFASRLADCEQHPDHVADYDWGGVRPILNTLLSAFHAVDEEQLSSAEVFTE